ncbi:hypothetical protein MATL_G00251580 [Megalops atlanticus]|uniref:Uncharacterized protein n=1 Tax=Megalops atlanticus TaxID=7932 RepID=A0A9D3P9D9_MEGAT|nr:hypothetical protein MATL_G00251580 [Megalops atlanticus]
MSNCGNFHTQLVSIMEVLAKAAVAEISKLVDGSCAVLRLEMYRCQNENEALKTKLKLMERELRAARRSPARGSHCAERVSARVRSHRASPVSPTGAADFAVGDREECDLMPKPAEAPEEKVAQPAPAEDPQEQVTQTPAGDPEELGGKHRCGHSEEDLSGLEFVVKAEQEEEHVAQRLSQTGFEHSAGRMNNLDPEYVTYERDGHLWTSFTPGDSDIETDDPVCDNATEQYSQSLSVHTELQHAPAAEEASANSISSFAVPYVDMFDMIPVKKEAEMQGATGEEHTPPVERVFGQEWSFGVWRDAETTAVEEESTPLQSVMREESADMEENTPESLLIKEERLEDNLWSRDPQPTPAEEQVAQPTPAEHPKKHVTQHTPGEEQVTQLTPPEEQVAESIPAGDPEELGEKHRCGHSEEDLSGLEFVVKAEQEEEHVAQRLSQTGFEHNAGRLNNLDPEYVTYERDVESSGQERLLHISGSTERD